VLHSVAHVLISATFISDEECEGAYTPGPSRLASLAAARLLDPCVKGGGSMLDDFPLILASTAVKPLITFIAKFLFKSLELSVHVPIRAAACGG
jgi:hypothetical protein